MAAQTQKSSTNTSSRNNDQTRVSRLQEKHELDHLGDRYAAYVGHVKHLGDQRPQLQSLLVTTRSLEEEISGLKQTYEVEITEARRLVDDTANENAKMQLEVSRSQKLSQELQVRLSDEISLRRRAEGNQTLVERALEHKEKQLQEAVRDQEPPKRALAAVSRERDELEIIAASSREALERESLLRAEAQNNLETKREECEFRVKVLHQEVETRNARIDQLEDLLVLKEEQLNREHREKLEQAMIDARIKAEDEMTQQRFQSESILKSRIDELSVKHENDLIKLHQITDENLEFAAEVEVLKERNKVLEEKVNYVEKNVSSLERALEYEKVQRKADNTQNELRTENMLATLYEKETEYQDLLDIHVPLDAEIKKLRHLVDCEEKRLGLGGTLPSQSEGRRHGRPSTAPGLLLTPEIKEGSMKYQPNYESGHFTFTDGKNKADKTEHSASMAFWSSHVVDEALSYATIQIKIWDVDRRGNYVKLLNTSNQAESLGGYSLRQTSMGNKLVAVYKFHQRFIMQPGASVTIWAAKSRAIHNPPSDLLWTEQASWGTGLGVNTTLQNMYGQAVAGFNLSRKQRDSTFPKIPEVEAISSRNFEASGTFSSLKKSGQFGSSKAQPVSSQHLPFDVPKSRQPRRGVQKEKFDASFMSHSKRDQVHLSRFVQQQNASFQ